MRHVIGLEIKAVTLLIALLSVLTWAAGHTVIYTIIPQFPPELFYLTAWIHETNVKSVSPKWMLLNP